MLKFVPALVILVGFYLYDVSCQAPVNQQCMACLCEAASDCDVKVIWRTGFYGPFMMTRAYWLDAGKPTLHNEPDDAITAYSNCASDIYCSKVAVQAYMEKYQRDCNSDGKIDCDDFVRIHMLGPFGCEGTLPENYNNRYLQCKRIVIGVEPDIVSTSEPTVSFNIQQLTINYTRIHTITRIYELNEIA